MTDVPPWIDPIGNLARGLPVLLVEGDDDALLFRHFLSQYVPGWDLQLHLAAAGNKSRVISGVAVHRPDWLGVIDKDEWSPDDLVAAEARSPRLRSLPRFCIESYFCHPAEIWVALPVRRRDEAGNALEDLADPILGKLAAWVAHGAMWRVLRRLYHATRLPSRLENEPVTNEDEIRQILQSWHDQLAPDRVLLEYREELAKAQQMSHDDQLKKHIHGKKFFNQVVVPALDHLFAGAGRADWLQRFRDEQIQPPDDLKMLLNWILSLIPGPIASAGSITPSPL